MRLENAAVEKYVSILKEPSRPPSRGGDTAALHQHVLTIGGERYAFLALGSKRWVFKTDTVSFDWEWDDTKRYRNIIRESLTALDKNGKGIVRGNRGWKPQLRTAETRMPVSRREQRR